MATTVGYSPQSEVQIKVHQWRNGNTAVHPVEMTATRVNPSSGPAFSRDLKHLTKWVPWLIPSIVVANVVMFLVTMYINNCPEDGAVYKCVARFLGRFSFQPFKENPLLGPSAYTLERLGALDRQKVVHEHQGWRLLTCIWLHAGVFHLLANMLSLVVIGLRLEQEFGFVRVGFLYVISGLGGSILSALFFRQDISVGASGAVFGLLGSMLSELITNWSMYTNKVTSLVILVVIIAVNLAFGILPHVDNFSHIGGFLSGFLLGFVFLIRPQFSWIRQRYASPNYLASSRNPKFKVYQYILWVISLILLIVGFTVGLVLLLRGVNLNDQCSWCHYLSCVPTSKWSCRPTVAKCLVQQSGDQFTIACLGSDKSKVFSAHNSSPYRIQEQCGLLCS